MPLSRSRGIPFGFLFSALGLMASEPVLLSPVKQFDIQTKVPPDYGVVTTRAFRARSTGLYFLVTTSPGGQRHAVLWTDYAGTVKGLISVSERLEADWIDVAENGDIYLLKRRNRRNSYSDEYLVYGSDGTAKAAHPSGPFSAQRVRTLDGFLKLLPSGEFRLTRGAENSEAQSLGQVHGPLSESVASCQTSKAAIFVERKSAIAHLVDSATGRVRSVPILSDEITAARASYPDSPSKPIIVSNVTCDGEGLAYLTLSGIVLARGAVVLQVTATGEVVRTLRCKLPRFEKYAMAGNQEGHMFPTLIGVEGRSLYLVDVKGNVAEFLF